MEPQVFALIVGVDEYIHPAIPNLSGCAKDANDIKRALLSRYPGAQCHLLVNENATRAKILADLRTRLIDNPQISPDDIMVVYFAGHGQRYETQRREVDAVVPVDYGLDVPAISDANLHELLQELLKKGPNVTLILDCCFAQSNAVTAVRRIQDPLWPAHATMLSLRALQR
uniref:Peptidase C14 caspase domain-containing protein n=1 Tax=Mycena chlorophos TaxID=658473 RepID=A0ABQ0LA61_MYCCL|nr:predicted protein [Mycena chlorophos]